MKQVWKDAGFTYIPETGWYEDKCPKCQGIMVGHEVGYTCKNCELKGDYYHYFLDIRGLDSLKAETAVKFYKENNEENEKINPNQIASRILCSRNMIFLSGGFYEYSLGVYRRIEDIKLDKYIKSIVGLVFRKNLANEIRNSMAVEINKRPDEVNTNRNIINFPNGLLDLTTLKLSSHNPTYLSTIQLTLNYDPDAQCPLWEKTLDQIFENGHEKIKLLQQFLGYCLTPDNKFQASLFNVGEGANGKSLIMTTFQNILGRENYSAIQMGDLGTKYYIAGLANKLVNISIESDSKLPVNDTAFKAIVTGDEIQIEEKHKQPYPIRPFCKLIFNMNDFPRVDDKSDAFYRRLLILKYSKQFKDKEADRELKFKLEKEYSGIMNWLIYGMKTLYKNNGFSLDQEMEGHILEYRQDNNNVYAFADECIDFTIPNALSTKKDVYERYHKFCLKNGYKPLAIRRLGKELKKIRPDLHEATNGTNRIWRGIALIAE